MANYKIITDSCCDLPVEKIRALDLSVIPLNLLFRGETRLDAVTDEIKEIYDGLRAGETASTSAVNPDGWASVIEPVLKEGKDALVLCFSSGLSTTYQSAVIAANELKETYPDRTINVVDTLCASLGQGLLVWLACDKRDAGLSLSEPSDKRLCQRRRYKHTDKHCKHRHRLSARVAVIIGIDVVRHLLKGEL